MFKEKPDREYKPVVAPSAEQPWSEYARASNLSMPGRPVSRKSGMLPTGLINMVRDNFTISSWLLMGACLQCGLLAAFGKFVAVIPVAILAIRLAETLLQVAGVLKNPRMEGVIPGSTTCFFPDEQGSYSGSPSATPIAVLHISVRSNHPLGMLAPGFKEIGDYFSNCVKWLEEDSHARGFLGMTQWLNSGDRTSSNELLAIGYFRSVEDIHALAHHAVHAAAWSYWTKHRTGMPYITLTHEIFAAQPGQWEAIFLNSKPTCLGSTMVKTPSDGMWRSPLVRVSGPLKTSAGRMDLEQTEHQLNRTAQAFRQNEYSDITP